MATAVAITGAKAQVPGPGDTIGQKYAIVRLLGEGAMGVVYEATHIRLQQRLAIKFLRPDVPDFGHVLARFEREARATAQLRSIHTARIIDADATPEGLPFIVMEYLEGRDLEVELEAERPMSVADAVDIVLQITEAMSEAHAIGIVHRDLKPSNLFVSRVASRRFIRVLDFGLSRDMVEGSSDRITHRNTYFGTPYYASPEQLRGAWQADARSDIWSTGTILYELLTGRTPFIGAPVQVITRVVSDPVPHPSVFRADLPQQLCDVVMRALERDPARRFATMLQMADALAPFAPKAERAPQRTRARSKLGEILVREGLLAPADLDCALAEQQRTGHLLGRVLLDLGLVSQVDLMTTLAMQQGIAPAARISGAFDDHEPGDGSGAAGGELDLGPSLREGARAMATSTPPDPSMPVAGLPRRRAGLWTAMGVGASLALLAVIAVVMALRSRPEPLPVAPALVAAPQAALLPSVALAAASTAPAWPDLAAPAVAGTAFRPLSGREAGGRAPGLAARRPPPATGPAAHGAAGAAVAPTSSASLPEAGPPAIESPTGPQPAATFDPASL